MGTGKFPFDDGENVGITLFDGATVGKRVGVLLGASVVRL